jgi:hypothetical protein
MKGMGPVDGDGIWPAGPALLSVAFIWLAHIGIDRALDYGLKYSTGFAFTHLGRIGKNGLAASNQIDFPS